MNDAPKTPALRNVRSLIERNRHDSGLDRQSAAPQTVRSVGIVGAGMMGAAIATVHLKHNLPVVISDTDAAALRAVAGKVAAELADHLPEVPARELIGRLLQPTTDAAAVARCELIIESIVETAPAKQQLYAWLQPHLAGSTILTSNTSTIPIARLAAALDEPGRFCGLHFFHPVRERPLAEIVCGPQTGDRTIATAVAHAKAVGKMPIVVADGPGFLVNRLLLPYLGEALQLLLEGARIEQIERAATDFGMAKGPLTLLDEIGLDTALQGGLILLEAFPDRIVASPLLVAMIKAGRLGRKSGAGFFAYGDATTETAWGRLDPAVDQIAVDRIIAPWAGPSQQHPPDSIAARLMLPMVLEATRILEEGKVRDPRDIDLGVLFGLGFPAARGGLLWWADTLSAARVVEMLRPLKSLGPRGRPTPLLQDLARSGGRFYAT